MTVWVQQLSASTKGRFCLLEARVLSHAENGVWIEVWSVAGYTAHFVCAESGACPPSRNEASVYQTERRRN